MQKLLVHIISCTSICIIIYTVYYTHNYIEGKATLGRASTTHSIQLLYYQNKLTHTHHNNNNSVNLLVHARFL